MGNLVRAVVVCGAGLMLAPAALAQLAPVPGGTVVTITSPPSGSRVTGAIAVSASASATGPSGITGVQFKLDGTDLGAQDSAAPYTVPWNSAAATDGWHTLTAVARDANGFEYSSDPVTIRVSNSAPPAATVQRYEETDARVSYSAGWSQLQAGVPLKAGWLRDDTSWLAWSGGSAEE
ncbi:MAG TPA: Ig-like domain-containing protein, partial [Polyangiaceae bacterium]|nr:Ig-like domain-containing protein [Polyangiaceae bacterium]